MEAQPLGPRTEDVIVYDLVRTDPRGGQDDVVGTATYAAGRTSVDAPESVSTAVEELLARAFVDRVQADERPRGYRRSGSGTVDMLVPGMAEHFVARMRGLWLSYPDGTVVVARPSQPSAVGVTTRLPTSGVEAGPAVTDPSVRRATLAESDEILNARPLVIGNAPLTGVRPSDERIGVTRTDCGWIC